MLFNSPIQRIRHPKVVDAIQAQVFALLWRNACAWRDRQILQLFVADAPGVDFETCLPRYHVNDVDVVPTVWHADVHFLADAPGWQV